MYQFCLIWVQIKLPLKTMTAWRRTHTYLHIFLTYAHYVKKSGQLQTMAALTPLPINYEGGWASEPG